MLLKRIDDIRERIAKNHCKISVIVYTKKDWLIYKRFRQATSTRSKKLSRLRCPFWLVTRKYLVSKVSKLWNKIYPLDLSLRNIVWNRTKRESSFFGKISWIYFTDFVRMALRYFAIAWSSAMQQKLVDEIAIEMTGHLSNLLEMLQHNIDRKTM